jgi:hypothetical protein
MKPYLQAMELYPGDQLSSMLDFCAQHGIIFSDDELFLCVYPTHSSLLRQNPNIASVETKSKKRVDIPDTWYVFIAIGKISKGFEISEPLEYLAYERFDGEFRIHSFERIRRLSWEA